MDRTTRLHRYVLQELPAADRSALEAQMATDPSLRADLDRLNAEAADFFARFPPSELVPKISARLAQRRGPPARRTSLALAVALAGAAASVVAVVAGLQPSHSPQGEDTVLKGSGAPALWVFRKDGPRAELLVDGAAVHPGEVLQLRYSAGGNAHAVILSVDGAGQVTLHSPSGRDSSTKVARGGAIDLPYAYRLDATPGNERFFLLTSRQPISVDDAMAAARAIADGRAGALALPVAVDQVSIAVRKASP